MERKHLIFIFPVVLLVMVLLCNLTGALVGGQASTITLGYAVAEQAQANQEMAHAVRTQANANVWIVGIVVFGMIAALVLGLVFGRQSHGGLPPIQPTVALPASQVHQLPPGTTPIPPDQVLNHLLPGGIYERRR